MADAVIGGGLTRAASGAGAALGEGLAAGLEAGSFLGPAGAVIGGMIGVGIAYIVFNSASSSPASKATVTVTEPVEIDPSAGGAAGRPIDDNDLSRDAE